jgi:hypothetical protein
MCQRVACPVCQKPSYAGCGRHIEQVLGDVPKEARCKCREQPKTEAVDRPGFLDRLFGKARE